MGVTVQTGTTLAFERFWRWLLDHPNCILRAGSSDCALYDQEELHWHLGEDPDRHPFVQLVWGKRIVGEMVLDVHEVLFVQATPDTDPEDPGRFLFELIGGPKEEAYTLYHFLVAHGLEEEEAHQALKH